MKKIGLVFAAVITICILAGCVLKKETTTLVSETSESVAESSSSSEAEETENNNQFEVGEKLFTINIPDFNVLPEGDMSDENGNTWLILQSEKYDHLLIQLSLHNKSSDNEPDDYSLDDLDIIPSNPEKANYHNFQREETRDIEKSLGKIYNFETETMEGQIVFISEEKLTAKEKNYFEEMIKSIKITD